MSNPKKKFVDVLSDNNFSGVFGNNFGTPINDVDLQNIYGKFVNASSKPGTRGFNLTESEINRGGVNAAYISGADRSFEGNAIPTYNGSAILPEITITPNSTYIYDPINNAARFPYRQSLTTVPTLQPRRYYKIRK